VCADRFVAGSGAGPAWSLPARAPQVDDLDAETNPAFAPVHTYHVGLWFGSPQEAAAAGCPATITPFDGDQSAGIQPFSTRNFGTLHGPLRQIQ
jgi:hypothetical protein